MSARPATQRPAGGAAAWGRLAVILAAYVLAFMDRQMLNLLVQPIKHALHLTDTEISLLQGLTFALALSLVALPVGRLIDTGRRTFVLAGGVLVWSAMTAGCGLAYAFPLLALARAGVAAGESVMTPAALSLIGDLFPPRRLGLATGIYASGVHLGSGLALLVGAGLLHLAKGTGADGWRAVFFAMGGLGLPVALAVVLLPEPVRGGGRTATAPVSFAEALAFLRAQGWAQACANLAAGLALMASYGVSAWIAAYFARRFHWGPQAFGAAYGPLTILAGLAGVLMASAIGDAWRGRGAVDARLRIMAAAALIAAPLAAAAPWVSAPAPALALFAAAAFFTAAAAGSGPSVLQDLAPSQFRGVTHAVALLTVNLVALGLGPTAVALVTDYGLHDETAVGVSLSVVPALALLLSCAFSLFGSGPFRRATGARAFSDLME